MRKAWFAALVILGGLSACTPKEPTTQGPPLQQIGTELDQRHYDQAVAAADAYLRQNPAGPQAAQALYLKGRALEDKPASSPAESRNNWQQARQNYVQALGQSPPPKLEAYIRSALANVAYFQEDFTTAHQQWSAAADSLDHPDLKAWALYRAAVSLQRLGQFPDADKLFAAVQKDYPNTVPAQRAKERHGVRAFHLQLATFRSTASADKAVAAARAQGLTAHHTPNPRGLHIVRVGPLPTYADARRLQHRFAPQYPDALIVP